MALGLVWRRRDAELSGKGGVVLGQPRAEGVSGWTGVDLGGSELAVLPGLVVLSVLVLIAVCGLIVLFVDHRRNRHKSLSDREAETFAAAVTSWDFDAAERSLRWAIAIAQPGKAAGDAESAV